MQYNFSRYANINKIIKFIEEEGQVEIIIIADPKQIN